MKKELKILLWGAAGAVALFSIYLVVVFSFWLSSKNYIYPGVSVAGIKLGGKTKDQATQILKEKVPEGEILFDGQAVKDLELVYNYEKTAQKALEAGQKNPFILGKNNQVPLEFSFNSDALYETLKNFENKNRIIAINSKISDINDLKIIEGRVGRHLNYAQTVFNLLEAARVAKKSFGPSFVTVGPTFVSDDLVLAKEQFNNLIPKELVLMAGGSEHRVSSSQIIGWASLGGESPSFAKRFCGEPFLRPLLGTENNSLFSDEAVNNYLVELSGIINTTPKNAILAVSDNKVVVAASEVNGQQLNTRQSAAKIIEALTGKQQSVELVVDTKKAEIRSDNLTDLGLAELVSIGSSNFAGSPTNRIHNIQTGASKFNGILIKPDEEFSFNTNLGPVDASTGYRPELVILENKTQPQFGGGLCQVSSTAFRAALNAGLPITARKAHAYPVSYYKPFGVDATIYLPNPDLKFKNDTGKYIYIQTRIVGKNLYFDFYGTKPQRTISFAGNESGAGAVNQVEKVTPFIYDAGVRGNGSFTAVIYRFITDSDGKTTTYKWVSKYDSPDKYPH